MTRSIADALDKDDPFAALKSEFVLPAGIIYLVGHSLGPATASALDRVAQAATSEWADGLVGSWNEAGWFELAEATGHRLARLVGAKAGEVQVCDNVSVNLFKLSTAAFRLARGEAVIKVEDDEFPTDQYIAEAHAAIVGAKVQRLSPGEGLASLATGGVLIKSVVNYRSGEVMDIVAHENAARDSGAVIVWDLSHATGVVNLDLNRMGVRLAVGCTYKYLNGGPGAPAFVYASRDIIEDMDNPLPGWMGHAKPFDFAGSYEPRESAARFASGTPGILSLSALAGALDVFDQVDMTALSAKAASLGDFCIKLADEMGLEVTSPRDGAKRGGHVSVRIQGNGYPVVQAWAAQGVKSDFRTPDTVRIGCSPLFLDHGDIWDAMSRLDGILQSGSWDQPQFHQRAKVT